MIDLEATCCDQDAIPVGKTAIIEIGAVMADARSLQAFDEFGCFVRPVRNPQLTVFCTELTSIKRIKKETIEAAQRERPDLLLDE